MQWRESKNLWSRKTDGFTAWRPTVFRCLSDVSHWCGRRAALCENIFFFFFSNPLWLRVQPCRLGRGMIARDNQHMAPPDTLEPWVSTLLWHPSTTATLKMRRTCTRAPSFSSVQYMLQDNSRFNILNLITSEPKSDLLPCFTPWPLNW